ncbi:MAG TPA: glycosyltransferase family 2 protein [Pyrinomonadaceae bacterium]|nr:glycosyltransferase family 2 protein [Pyrinomonadaceae bacterium]
MNKPVPLPNEFVSVLLPLYCEGSHIRQVLAQVHHALANVAVAYEIILVDDGSPDNTWDVISEEAALSPVIRAVKLSRNFGKESALCAGIELARGDAVVVMDGDGQHPPALLPEMIRLWRATGVDIVEGSKVTRGEETIVGKLSAGLFYLIWNKLSGYELKGASDFKLLSRKTIDAWLQMEERNLFFRGMTAWLGFTRIQVPFEVEERAGGRSGWSFIKRLRLALTGISAFSSLPLQFVTFAGAFFLFFSFAFGFYTLVLQFSGKSVTGFATVILLLLIVGSLLMISMGIIGAYLARIYEEVKKRPRYVIAHSTEAAASQRTNYKALSAVGR